MRLNSKKLLMVATLGLSSLTAASPAHALAYAFDATVWQFMSQMQQHFQGLNRNLDNNFNTIDRTLRELSRLNSDALNMASRAVQNATRDAQSGAVSRALQQNGTSYSNINNTIGHISTDYASQQFDSIKQAKNVLDAVTMQTSITLENQLRDRLNVGSFLDEKPANGQCTTIAADKCTVLKLLREKEAVSLQKLHNQTLLAGNLAAEIGSQWNQYLLNNIKYGNPAIGSKTDLVSFLTAENSVPLGYDKANNPKVHNLQRARLLADIMAGTKNDINILAPSTVEAASKTSQPQLDAMSRLSKVQIAKAAIMNVHNDELHDAMNNQFKACVGRPDAQDTVGSTTEQHLVQVQSLLRCQNLILMQSQQRQLESDRLSGAILLTLLDIYSVQAPQEVTTK